MSNIMSLEEWEKEYGAEGLNDCGFEKGDDTSLIWTQIETEHGGQYIIKGVFGVNSIRFWRAEIEKEDDDNITVVVIEEPEYNDGEF